MTPRRVRFVESEYAVPRESLLDVLAELRAGVARLADPVMFPVEVRVAAADDIWLSTAYGRDSAYVAIHQYVGLPYQDYFRLFESIATSVGGRPHWGKMHTRAASYLHSVYPRFADFLSIRDSLDPARRFVNPYLHRSSVNRVALKIKVKIKNQLWQWARGDYRRRSFGRSAANLPASPSCPGSCQPGPLAVPMSRILLPYVSGSGRWVTPLALTWQ